MRILIAGAGSIGSKLAENLVQEGHDVVVIEGNSKVASRLSEKLDVMVVTGNAGSPAVLESAGVEATDMLIAVTDSDAMNIVVSLLGREYGVRTKIARIRNPEYTRPGVRLTPRDLGIDRVINPEQITIDSMVRLLAIPGSTEIADFGGGEVLMLGFDVSPGANIVGHTLENLKQKLAADPFLIVAIYRDNELIIPGGSDSICAHDKIYVFMPRGAQDMFLGLLSTNGDGRVPLIERVLIYGATRIGLGLAVAMEKTGGFKQITLVDPDAERCLAASEVLSSTLVLQGEATDPDMLHDASIDEMDFIVTVSDDDETNLMAALLAKQMKAKRAMVLTGKAEYVPILDETHIDVVVNPRLLTVGAILRYARRGIILSVSKLGEHAAEAIEVLAVKDSPIVKQPLKDVFRDFPKGAIVGAILRSGRMIIPDGDCIVKPGEKVVVFSLESVAGEVEKLFTRS